MKALVIYDQVGYIWSITYGGNTAPQGLLHMWVNIPDGAGLERIDVSDEKNPQPIFTYLPDTDIEKLQKRVTDLDTAVQEQYEADQREFNSIAEYQMDLDYRLSKTELGL